MKRTKETILESLKNEYSEQAAEKLQQYIARILEKNEHINLTAITDETEALEKHIVDSLSLCSTQEYAEATTVADMGTGAGFPGVPLAIVSPEKSFVLIDSLNKRLRVVAEICEDLQIKNVSFVHGRAEDVGHDSDMRAAFDMVTSRAVARLDVLSEWCLPLVKTGGTFAAYKGEQTEAEIREAKAAIKTMGGQIERIVDTGDTAKGDDGLMMEHRLVIIKKQTVTPKKYPRKPGEAKKKPIR